MSGIIENRSGAWRSRENEIYETLTNNSTSSCCFFVLVVSLSVLKCVDSFAILTRPQRSNRCRNNNYNFRWLYLLFLLWIFSFSCAVCKVYSCEMARNWHYDPWTNWFQNFSNCLHFVGFICVSLSSVISQPQQLKSKDTMQFEFFFGQQSQEWLDKHFGCGNLENFSAARRARAKQTENFVQRHWMEKLATLHWMDVDFSRNGSGKMLNWMQTNCICGAGTRKKDKQASKYASSYKCYQLHCIYFLNKNSNLSSYPNRMPCFTIPIELLVLFLTMR